MRKNLNTGLASNQSYKRYTRHLKKIPPAEEWAILIEMNLGEEDLNTSEKVFGWNYFARLSMTSGMIENPVNAISGSARAACQLRYDVGTEVDDTLPALQNHLHAHGFNYIEIRCDDQVRFTAACQDVDNIWIKRVLTFVLKKYWATCASIAQPCRLSDKGRFTDILCLATIWIPHIYRQCSQHAPTKHMPEAIFHKAIRNMTNPSNDLDPNLSWAFDIKAN